MTASNHSYRYSSMAVPLLGSSPTLNYLSEWFTDTKFIGGVSNPYTIVTALAATPPETAQLQIHCAQHTAKRRNAGTESSRKIGRNVTVSTRMGRILPCGCTTDVSMTWLITKERKKEDRENTSLPSCGTLRAGRQRDIEKSQSRPLWRRPHLPDGVLNARRECGCLLCGEACRGQRGWTGKDKAEW
jgi:hypothetical protein